MSLSTYASLCNSLVLLMKPLVEIVIHDLSAGRICYINGTLSKRTVGDPSLLEASELETDMDTIIYPKINFDGRLIKSISIPVENQWLICINVDASVFSQMKNLSEVFLNTSVESQPASLFKNDWKEKVHVAIHDFLARKSWKFKALNQTQKKELTKHLFDSGAFIEKNAADYVAQILNLGRATVFKYLKEWRNQ